jgi:hypothetical protein
MTVGDCAAHLAPYLVPPAKRPQKQGVVLLRLYGHGGQQRREALRSELIRE